MAFSPEPAHTHGLPSRTAVLMVNLGTPSAPTSPAVRRYLRQFLSDPRVVEIPRPLWWVILYGAVLPLRPRRSAAKYAAIWTEQGSPLMVHSQQQALLLRGYLGERGIDADVVLAMRYGEPSIEAALSTLAARSVERVLLLPMYPQYSATTTASAIDALNAALARRRNVPEVRWIRHFHDDLGYIEALAESVRRHWGRHGRAQDRGGKLVMSFHGVPKRVLKLGDPYHCECQKTARLLAEALKLTPEEYVVTFQSRFGRAEWLGPYTAPTLESLARAGATSVDVICPGFPADCLETLEEIGIEGRATFVAAGGRDFHLIPGLNDSPSFISALVDLCARHLQGWPVERSGAGQRTQQAEESRARARLQGAER